MNIVSTMRFSVFDPKFLREEPSAQCWDEVLFAAHIQRLKDPLSNPKLSKNDFGATEIEGFNNQIL
jgi:hypothetical protein